MNNRKFEDATVGMAQALQTDKKATEPNGIEDRTAAEILRRKGFSPERIERWFGYIPTPLSAEEPRPREHAVEDYGVAALASF